MLSRILSAISLGFILFMSGCAARPVNMAFSNDTDTVSKTGKSIYLMTVTLRNNFKTSYQPKLFGMHVEKAGAKSKEDKVNFAIDEKAKNETNLPEEGNSYLLRMELAPGDYVFRGMSSGVSKFPFVGKFYTPLDARMASTGPGVFYLGHVDATVRERQEGDFRAGALGPLLDQAVAGASTGTFDVEISDKWESDQPKFLAKFPMLQNMSIQRAILPPFDREQAQQDWERTMRQIDIITFGNDRIFGGAPRDVSKLDASGLSDAEKQSIKDHTYEKTDFAKLSDIAALPYVNAKARENYRMFLRAGYPRAFVIADDGGWAWTTGLPKTPSDPKDPLARAMQLCTNLGHTTCRPYAINGRVVWK